MKIKFLLILFCLVFFVNSILSQQPAQPIGFCYAPTNGINILPMVNVNNPPNPNGNFIVRVFVHIIRRTDGTGGQSFANVNTALAILVSDFAPHNICFSLVGIDEIKDSWLYDETDATAFYPGNVGNLNSVYHKPNAVNMYLFDDAKNMDGFGNGGGIVKGIPGYALFLGGKIDGVSLVTSKTISHEMGHCLGLYHTHQSINGIDCDRTCAGNCDVNGQCSCADFVCDTPPDDGLRFGKNVNQACQASYTDYTFPGQLPTVFPWGYPDPFNIMSYTRISCQLYFTDGQGKKMRISLNQYQLLQNFLVPDNLTFSNTILSGQTKLYNVRTNLTAFNLTTQPFANLTLRAGNQVKIEPGTAISQGSNLHAYIDYQCSTIDQNNSAKTAQKDKIKHINSHEIFTDMRTIPNPSNGNFRLQTPTIKGYANEIIIRDILGRTIWLTENPQQYEFDFNLENEVAGIYIISAYYGNEVLSKKIIKN